MYFPILNEENTKEPFRIIKIAGYLEAHPRTGKWLVTMVIVSPPKDRVCGTPSKWPRIYCLSMGVTPNHLLSGMILQVVDFMDFF